ncbi:MAG: ABC transporter permease [Rhodospirillaceae bacterium]|nr:ABC transporter permease [Rhodospirillaceae bacterium]MBT5244869.1 ABC transporter permease [Rhodospirillaceae bacterium]MBT5562221.1 ABC transporter permease [Rhodospirillaceae bacterium]MBT6242394.1 ABC transporter permease [Rhodospirillaceae bacterium]MBT7138889.1 ABC transporter permease [Rhodospirillaceae bacterium]
MLDLKGYGWTLWDGLQMTLSVGVLALCVAFVMGMLGAWGKLSKSPVARGAAGTYTTVIRGVPELLLILLIYYGTPTLIQNTLEGFGYDIIVDINPFIAGVITIGVIYGAFATEVLRGAILAVPKGQIEAAHAFGMSRKQVVVRVLLPQVWRFALPGLGNVWMVLLKATSLISVIQLPELLRKTDMAARSTKLPFTFFFAAAMIYLAITLISMFAQQRMEAWANRGVRRG